MNTNRPFRIRLILAAAGSVAVLAAAALVSQRPSHSLAPPARRPPPARSEPAAVTPIDETAARTHAWQRAEPLLADAQRQAEAALDQHLAGIPAFLAERRPGVRAFAERMVSLKGKWELVKSHLGKDGDQEYAGFLDKAFAEHVFRGEELQQAVESAIRAYLAELDRAEASLLVRLRADLSADELPLQTVIPALRSDEALTRHYQQLAERVTQDLRTDLAFVAGRELFLWQATNVVTDLTVKAGAAVTARLGISATIFSAGAASSWRTLGVSLVVAFVLDAVINQIIKAAGYDAEERVAERIGQTLDDLGRTIADGDAAARDTLAQLKTLQTGDPDAEVRDACTKAIARIEAGTQLYGLRGELTKIGAARASLRKEALRRLILNTEVIP